MQHQANQAWPQTAPTRGNRNLTTSTSSSWFLVLLLVMVMVLPPLLLLMLLLGLSNACHSCSLT